MRVAIVHDYLTQRGGAERVVLALHHMFPDAPLYTSVYDPGGTFQEFRAADVRTGFLQRLPHAGSLVRAYLPLYPALFGRLRISGYDVVISSSSGWAHGVRTEGAFHVCYCHTPARWLYQTDAYLSEGAPVPSWTRPALAPALAALRWWDRRAARHPDAYVANSLGTSWRIRQAYGRRPASVVYPPVDVQRFPFPADDAGDGFYLVVARLLAYKRIDLAVRACSARDVPLVVVGAGPARASLERIASPAIRFMDRVPDAELVRLYSRARALIQCGHEDFGIAPLEANAAGRPVVAYAAGGALETVADGETGVLFRSQTVEGLTAALDRLEARTWDARVLRAHAARFGEGRFADEMRAVIADAAAGRRVA